MYFEGQNLISSSFQIARKKIREKKDFHVKLTFDKICALPNLSSKFIKYDFLLLSKIWQFNTRFLIKIFNASLKYIYQR